MSDAPDRPWYRELNGYHWFVLIVCTLGWLFDCLDQQLFNIARPHAVRDLIPADADVNYYSTLATSILLVGWATGGIIFGIMGDRIGRAKTMFWTILAYSVFTGLTGFAVSIWDFILYRFLCGLGVGGQFAVGVSLVAETMPERARPHALGMLQAFSAVGNVTAGFIGIGFSMLAAAAIVDDFWRWLFAIGILPALLAVVVITRLREPERWKEAVAEKGKQRAGSLGEMFGVAQWRRRAIVGMILASSGIIGLWAIGVFSNDLIASIFRKEYQQEYRDTYATHQKTDGKEGQAYPDREFLQLLVAHPEKLDEAREKLQARDLLSMEPADKAPELLYSAALDLKKKGETVSEATVLEIAQSKLEAVRKTAVGRDTQLTGYLEGVSPPAGDFSKYLEQIAERKKDIDSKAGWWTSANLLLFNVGAFFGIYLFSRVTSRIGRRPTFAIFFLAALLATSMTFLFISKPSDIFWMTPLMGAAQLSVFGGYAIYFPELFPTRLRATGTSLCYNVARYVAALGPLFMGQLATGVFGQTAEPLRYAGVTMCVFFLIGIAVLPFAPETKDLPLPE